MDFDFELKEYWLNSMEFSIREFSWVLIYLIVFKIAHDIFLPFDIDFRILSMTMSHLFLFSLRLVVLRDLIMLDFANIFSITEMRLAKM